ncbi:MAG: hypothetical protein WAM92_13770 [Mycobacterium sp.]
MTVPRQQHSTLIVMTALAVLCSAIPALCLGYVVGHRAGSTNLAAGRHRRALGKGAVRFLALMIARGVHRSVERKLSAEGTLMIARVRALAPRRRPIRTVGSTAAVVKRLGDLRYASSRS